jgi:excisionase family DNA binding protein
MIRYMKCMDPLPAPSPTALSTDDPGGPDFEFLTVAEAADLLRLNAKTLYAFISEEDPQWARRFGRAIRVSRSGLLEWSRGNSGSALGSRR